MVLPKKLALVSTLFSYNNFFIFNFEFDVFSACVNFRP